MAGIFNSAIFNNAIFNTGVTISGDNITGGGGGGGAGYYVDRGEKLLKFSQAIKEDSGLLEIMPIIFYVKKVIENDNRND